MKVLASVLALFLAALLAGIASNPGHVLWSFQTGLSEKAWVDSTLHTLSLRDKIAQLVLIRVGGAYTNLESSQFLELKEQVRETNLGGVVLFAGNVYESAVLLNDLQATSRLPLLVAADFESGASFRISDTTSFPWAMAVGATGSEQFAYEQGMITAQEARALGVHWILAPVMDVNNNPDNPVINIRSYGESPRLVARLGSAFIRGARAGGALTTAKHFPGHGDTATDSHVGLPVIQSDIARLQSTELVPFKSAIEAGVDAVMTAHIALPGITGKSRLPATLSSEIMTGLLRTELNFRGLVVTDALEMNGVTDHYWCGLAAIRAIQAGADILLLPPNALVAIREIERAVKRGDISETRIDQSARRVLLAKSSLGLHRSRTVSIRRIGETVASPLNLSLAQEIANHSITVVKDAQGLIPIDRVSGTRVLSLVLSAGLDSSPAAVFQAEMRRRFSSIRTLWANARISAEEVSDIRRAASNADIIVVSTLVRLASGRNTLAIPKRQRTVLREIIDSRKHVIWLAFGNPYVFELAPRAGTYLCTFSYSDVSQIAAAKALTGEIAVTGTLPVRIPGHFEIGDGLSIPKLEMILKEADTSNRDFQKTRQVLTSLVAQGVLAGGELLVGQNGTLILHFGFGRSRDGAGSTADRPNALYDIGELSKVVATAPGAMLTTRSGGLILNAPVQDYLPEFKGEGKQRVKVLDLLTGRSGISTSLPAVEEIKDYEKLIATICAAPLAHKPGTTASDSELNRILLEEIVSRASGLPFGRLLTLRLFDPLGMNTILLDPSAGSVMPLERETRYGIISRPAAQWDATRVFCRARDLAVFSQMMLNGGIYDHHRYFSSAIVEQFTGSQKTSKGVRALGWKKPSNSDWTAGLFSAKAFGYSASRGNSLWIDPAKRLFVILLISGKPDGIGNKAIEEAQKQIHESAFEDLAHAPGY